MEINTADVVLCEFYFINSKTSKKRPVLVLKDNLPYDDSVGIPISSQIDQLHPDEHEIDNSAFNHGGIPKKSKLILRKPFVISKTAIIKKYGTLNETTFKNITNCFVITSIAYKHSLFSMDNNPLVSCSSDNSPYPLQKVRDRVANSVSLRCF